MKIKVFSIYDVKTEIYAHPFFMASEGAALRAWMDLVNDGRSAISAHPEDYCLFVIGEYDDSSGQIANIVPPKSLGLGIEMKKEQMPVQFKETYKETTGKNWVGAMPSKESAEKYIQENKN